MAGSPTTALVLSGGGARAAYQVGVLRYLGRRCPDGRFPIVTGVSAGAINSVYLAAHRGDLAEATRDLSDRWKRLTTSQVFRYDVRTVGSIAGKWAYALSTGGTRLGPRARSLVDTTPLRDYLREVIDVAGIARNVDDGRLRAAAVTATSYQTGRTVTFVQGQPDVPLWRRPQRVGMRDRLTVDHVLASSALPLFFPAVQLDGHYYGDGSIRQAAPLSPAIHLGARRILAVSIRYDRTVREARVPVRAGYPPPAQVLALLFNNIFLDALDADAERARRINELLEACGPGQEPDPDLRKLELLVLRPSADLGRIAADYQERLPRMLRFLVGGLGAGGEKSADFLSYLLFEPGYLGRLMELGERDAEARWPEIERFLGWD